MKKILQATGQKDHAGLNAPQPPEAGSSKTPQHPVSFQLDLRDCDQDTRRAIQVVLYRMTPHARRALVHGANIEAMMQLPSGYLINPYFADAQLGRDGLVAFNHLAGASENGQLQPTATLIQSLTGALIASAD